MSNSPFGINDELFAFVVAAIGGYLLASFHSGEWIVIFP